MAGVEIISDNAPYYTVKVSFGSHEFIQVITSPKTGAGLQKQLQDYADDYEAQFTAAAAQEPQE
jgi:hypothetical protein